MSSIWNRKLDLVYVLYFVQHIVITILIDCTIVIPEQYLFEIQSKLGRFHVESNNDLLVANARPWLKGFVWVEVLIQLPFFFYGAYQFYKGSKKVYIPTLVYAVEAAVTTFACLVELFYIDVDQKTFISLFLMYLPIFVIPSLMVLDMSVRLGSFITANEAKVKAN